MKLPFPRLLLSSALAVSVAWPGAARAGSVARLFYEGIPTGLRADAQPDNVRNSVSTLTADSKFPNSPTYREQLDDFSLFNGAVVPGLQGRDNSGVDYGTWIRGYLEAPATGVYRFGIASDNNSSLLLSTNHVATNAVEIAYELGAGEPLFSGLRLDQRVSAPVQLVRGQKYYFEVRHKQGAGAAFVQVGWERPDGVQEIIPALHLAQFPDEPGQFTRTVTAPIFNTRGYLGGDLTNSVTLAEGEPLVLPLDIIAAQPTAFTWTSNGVALPGENLSFFRLDRVPASLHGKQLRGAVTNAFGGLVSTVTTLTITPDTTRPTVLAVDALGNPNLLQITYSEPVDPATSTNVANYQVRIPGGAVLPVQSAVLLADQRNVQLSGTFNFIPNANYQVTVQNVNDRATTPNILAPNPSVTAFAFTAPKGTTYDFNSGRPSGFSFYGQGEVISSGGVDGSGYLRITPGGLSGRNLNGAVLLSERRDIEQVRLSFKANFSDAGSVSGTNEPGDGLVINVAGDLPLGTYGQPEEGFTPNVPGNRFSVTFDSHSDGTDDPVAIGVLVNNSLLTNVLAGINGVPRNGIPSITSTDGRWVDVDVDLRRSGLLSIRFDGVTILTNFQTGFLGAKSAQIGFGARTRAWFQNHWIDDLTVNFSEGDFGPVSLSPDSVLGGTFPEGSRVVLSALPTGSGPFFYQWLKNGSPVSGATNRQHTFDAVVGAGGAFSLTVSNAFSQFTSESRAVVIQQDTIAPRLVGIRGLSGGVNRVLLSFDEAVDPGTASDLATYTSPLFLVESASVSPDGRTVVLQTTAQRTGASYPLTIAGLRDQSQLRNALTTNTVFVSAITYADEILADSPTRYFRFNETSGTVAKTELAQGDLTNTNGNYFANSPGVIAARTLVPSDTNGGAATFSRALTNYIVVPNGGDVNDFRGPWPKKTFEFWFNARTLPTNALNTTDAEQLFAQTAGLYEEGGNQRSIHFVLWKSPTNQTQGQAELVLHSFTDTFDGPGAPYGIRTQDPVYLAHTITTGVTYHVVGVFDGSTTDTNGQLRLYINSELVGTKVGIGQIYNHNGDVRIGSGSARAWFLDATPPAPPASPYSLTSPYGTFDGVIDDLSLFNSVLSEDRIRSHYLAGIGATTSAAIPPTLVESVDPNGNPFRVNVAFNQPVSPATAQNPANYAVRNAGGGGLAIQSATLMSDLKTVQLAGNFGFAAGSTYSVAVQNVADILEPTNRVALTNLSFVFVTDGPAVIDLAASDLEDKTVVENQTARFEVVATGQAPFSYQWFFNNVPLNGETNRSLAFSAPLEAAGAYRVAVSNEFSGVLSAPAQLAVLADGTVPRLTDLRGLAGSLNEVRLIFSEPVDPATGTNLATYAVSGHSLVGAALSEDGREVTLWTSPQTHGRTNQLTIAGLRDRAAVPNLLNVSAKFVSAISYRDELLADGAVRYWTFDQKQVDEPFDTLVSYYDTARENLLGILSNSPLPGLSGLVPNVPDNTAIGFVGSTFNRVELPNGRDLNAILGPWAKRTHVFSFRADQLPRITDGTNIASPAIYGHDRIGIYLYATQETNTPSEALLVFAAHNTTSEGPGTPWGNLSGNSANARYVSTPVQANRVYHVAAVLDGDPAGVSGQLKLYVNGQQVGVIGGVGQIYKHPNTNPTFGQANFRRHDGVAQSLTTNARLDGVIDEFAVFNDVLSAERIAQIYGYAQTAAVSPLGLPSLVRISVLNGNVVVTWDDGSTLQRADAVSGPFSDLPSATSPYTESVLGQPQRFFQLKN